ncbi:MAG TPA: hypothetical protein VF493_17980 [Terriglobales bacterium]
MHWVAQEVTRIPQVIALDRSRLSNGSTYTFGKGGGASLPGAHMRPDHAGPLPAGEWALILIPPSMRLIGSSSGHRRLRLSNTISSRDTGRDLTIN